MKLLDAKSHTCGAETERGAISKQTLNRFALSFTRALAVATCAAALILIVSPPHDRGHPIRCGEHSC